MSKNSPVSASLAEQHFLTEIADCFHRQAFLAQALAGACPEEKPGLPNSFVSLFVASEPAISGGAGSLGLRAAQRFAREAGVVAKELVAGCEVPEEICSAQDVPVFGMAFGCDSKGEHVRLNGERFELMADEASTPELDEKMASLFKLAGARPSSILAVDGMEQVAASKQRLVCDALRSGGFAQIVCQIGQGYYKEMLSGELRELSIAWEERPEALAPKGVAEEPRRARAGGSRR